MARSKTKHSPGNASKLIGIGMSWPSNHESVGPQVWVWWFWGTVLSRH